MNIQYKPQDENHPPDQPAHTNIGSFLPGEIRGVGPDQEKEAARLIENGEFVASDAEPNADDVTKAMPKAMDKFNAPPRPSVTKPRTRTQLPPRSPSKPLS